MMPAGTYYIGDLCYVMHENWNEFCSLTISGNECLDGEFNLKDGRRFASYGTKFGDGTYTASHGAELGVDAGLIGCILLSDIDRNNDQNDINLGTIVTFDHPFETGYVDGVIYFGNISIDTGYEEEEYDDEYDDEY